MSEEMNAADLAQRVADLEAERDELIDQRDRGDAQNDLLLAELRQVNTERDELRARLAEIEAQEPVALVETSGDQSAGIGWSGAAQPVGAKLYARPVPAIPEGWRLVPVEPTIAMCIAGGSPRMLVDDCTPTPAIYRAMCAAAPEHKA